MAFQQTFPNIVLEEKDIPGAVLPLIDISSNTVASLKRWLQTRGISTIGKKSDLVERITGCIDAAIPIDVKLDGGAWYKSKLMSLTTANPSVSSMQPPLPPVTGWSNFPSARIPQYFNKGHIYYYLVESAMVAGLGFKQQLDVKTAKPLKRGEEFFRSGHVQDIQDCINDNLYYCKSVVRASFQNAAYDVLVAICCNTGMVRDASCNCKASAMGRCSHVSGLLHAVADFLEKYGSTPCTDKICEWNQGRKSLRSPKKLSDCHIKEQKKFKAIDFDPRPKALRKTPKETISHFKTIIRASEVKSGWSLIFDEAPAAEETLNSGVSDYLLADSRKEELKQCREIFLESLRPTADHPVEIVRHQGSQEWLHQRSIRITASNCKAVKTAQTIETKSNILRRILWSSPLCTKEMEYGRENEKNALQDYSLHLPESMTLTDSGFWVNPAFPELGCSPDGIITDSTGQVLGLVEIKCPATLANNHVEEFEKTLKKTQLCAFCLERRSDGSLHLKRNHMYYFQVQMQLGIMEAAWCDFVVWTKHSFVVERIELDPCFWAALKLSLVQFHHKYLVPEYFEMRVPRGLSAICVD